MIQNIFSDVLKFRGFFEFFGKFQIKEKTTTTKQQTEILKDRGPVVRVQSVQINKRVYDFERPILVLVESTKQNQDYLT